VPHILASRAVRSHSGEPAAFVPHLMDMDDDHDLATDVLAASCAPNRRTRSESAQSPRCFEELTSSA